MTFKWPMSRSLFIQILLAPIRAPLIWIYYGSEWVLGVVEDVVTGLSEL